MMEVIVSRKESGHSAKFLKVKYTCNVFFVFAFLNKLYVDGKLLRIFLLNVGEIIVGVFSPCDFL